MELSRSSLYIHYCFSMYLSTAITFHTLQRTHTRDTEINIELAKSEITQTQHTISAGNNTSKGGGDRRTDMQMVDQQN